jgi:hypothetical protein
VHGFGARKATKTCARKGAFSRRKSHRFRRRFQPRKRSLIRLEGRVSGAFQGSFRAPKTHPGIESGSIRYFP